MRLSGIIIDGWNVNVQGHTDDDYFVLGRFRGEKGLQFLITLSSAAANLQSSFCTSKYETMMIDSVFDQIIIIDYISYYSN